MKEAAGRYARLKAARKLLSLPESVAMAEIRTRYREAVKEWHPDRNPEGDRAVCEEKTARIHEAYQELMGYCEEYRISFAEEDVARYLSGEEWWRHRFGQDPLWGRSGV